MNFLYHVFWSSPSSMALLAQLRASAFLTLLCLAAAAALCQPPQAPVDSSMQRDFQAAMAAEDSGDLDRAQQLLSALHARYPGLFEVNESLGLIYAGREDYAQALPLLEAAIEERSSSDVAHANLGAALYKLHRNAQALKELQRAVELNPGSATAQQSLGQVLLEDHQAELAAGAFSRAMRLKPGDDDLALSYATALVSSHQFDRASQVLASVSTAGQSALAQSLLGEIDEGTKDYAGAVRHLARAVELEPSEDNVWQLGVEFLRHWTFDAAEREFEAAAIKFPQSSRIRLGLGAAYFGDARYAKAIPVFADLLTSDPGNALYAELLGLSCTTVMTESKPECGALLGYAQAHPGDAKVATYAASTLLEKTQTEPQMQLARKLLESAIAADPNLAAAQYQMGVLKQNESDWAGSIPFLESALRLKPDYAKAHYHLALAYWRTGRKQDGEAEMELQKKFSKQQRQDLEQRVQQITTFLVQVHN
jgi:tetratricopeptide (TPR) repeat protein